MAAIDAGGNVGPAATVSLAIPDPTPPGAPAKVTARLTKDGKVHLAWAAATDNGKVASYRVLRAGKRIASGDSLAFVDKNAKPGSGSTVLYSVVAVDLAGNVGAAGKAKPLRAALLRKLGVADLSAVAGHRRREGARARQGQGLRRQGPLSPPHRQGNLARLQAEAERRHRRQPAHAGHHAR